MDEEIKKALTPKEAKKEKMRRKRQLRKEREIRRFCKDTANEELLFRFMKAYSMNESMALKTLNAVSYTHLDVYKRQAFTQPVSRPSARVQTEEKPRYQELEEDDREGIPSFFSRR